MISGAAQSSKMRRSTLKKTDAMCHADRQTGRILDEVWCNCNEAKAGKRMSVNWQQPFLSVPEAAAPPNNSSPLIVLERSEKEPDFLRLNIGGAVFLLLAESVLRVDQSSLLAKFTQLSHADRLKVADGFLEKEETYYFQRSPLAFEPIFQYYSTGTIHRPAELCNLSLMAELEFWRIPASCIAACCQEEVDTYPAKWGNEADDEKTDDASFEKLYCAKFRRRMWQFLERPGSSIQAKIFELSSTLFVAISVLGLSFATLPEFQVVERVPINETVQLPDGTSLMTMKYVDVRIEHPLFILIERVCIAFFTVEYLLRLFAAPRKLRFALKPLNVVDLLAILPFYLELVLTLCGANDARLRDLKWAFLVVRILRVLRVIRIIKLGRFSSGLQTFGMTLKRSQKQLQMMAIVLLTGVVFFSTVIYFLEKDEPGTPFISIPAAYWWCVVTMTTVGYGDIVPVTTLRQKSTRSIITEIKGKAVACVAIMGGVLVLALPITIIVDNFIKVAQEEQQIELLRLDDDGEGEEGERPLLLRRSSSYRQPDRRPSAAVVSALMV